MLIVWAFQFCINFFVILSTQLDLAAIYEEQLSPQFGITRLMTQIVMHVLIQGEFTQAFTMMKFSVNHPWKFRNPELAFCTGLL